MIQIYKASAGSGKTFTLAREYIKLILGEKGEDGRYRLRRIGSRPHHDSVLAITFTNKATNEMKSRIIHELAVLAGMERGWEKPSPYLKELCSEFECSAEALSAIAGQALKELLGDFNKFNVSTIDSFFQMVLRSFAHEADVSGSYEVELDDNSVISQSIDTLLQDINHEHQTEDTRRLIEWLTRFMTRLIEDGAKFNIFNRSLQVHKDLVTLITDITDDTYREHEKEILDYLCDPNKLTEFCNHIEGATRDYKQQTADACRAAITAINNDNGLEYVNKSSYNTIAKWAASGYYKPASKSYATMPSTAKIFKKSGCPESIESAVNSALSAIERCINHVHLLKIISANIYQLGLMARIAEYLNRFRRENSTILLSDTNALISKVIGNDNSPFLYEKIGTRFKHYLIDEFQDTSFSQWNNLAPLVNESLANDYDNLVIGDEKQCIYRFRGSDPSLLHNLHTKYEAGRAVVKGEALTENTNWRSAANIVRFNNTLFSAIARAEGLNDMYGGVAQMVADKNIDRAGYVRVNIFEVKSKQTTEADATNSALENLTANLRRQLESGYRAGDIAILVNRAAEGQMVINHLEQVRANDPGFPPFTIVSDKSLVISNSPAIMLIISRLRYISSIDFTPRSRKKSQREVAQVINDFEECYAQTQDGSAALASAIERMAVRNRTETDDDQTDSPDATEVMTADLDLISLVESIIANLVQGSSLDAEGVYITAFQDMVAEFTSKERSDVRSFLEWWDSVGSKASVAGADDPTALNILTIHKAKGLQYACVHVPFAGFTINYSAVDRAWFKIPPLAGIPAEIMPPFLPLNMSKLMTTTSLEEPYNTYQKQRQIDFINLLYVALTRAVDELIVGIRVTGSDNSGQGSWTLANTVINAMRQANPSFCAQLLSEAALPPDTPSPFTPIDSIVDNIFEHGKPTVATIQQKNKDSALTPSAGETTTTYKVYGTKTPWENTRLSKDKVNRVSIARERGIILHQILARIATPTDIDKAMQMTLASDDNRILSPDDAAELRRIVELRVNAPKARQWFTGFKRLLREQEVLTDSGSTKRFDRVVWTANGEIHLIDYKTGAQPASSYKSQILDYLNFFKSVGYIGVRAFLYYIDSGRITEIV